MTTTTPAVDAMIDGRRANSTRRRQRVLAALDNGIKDGAELSITDIARRARVDRTFLYRHRDLLERIHAAETQLLVALPSPRQAGIAGNRRYSTQRQDR
jgi:hypothetical protein